MDHLAHDLNLALEESESCGPTAIFQVTKRWGMRRRTRSAGNLHLCVNKTVDIRSDDTSSGESENRINNIKLQAHKYVTSFHHSDSDDASVDPPVISKVPLKQNYAFKQIKHRMPALFNLQEYNSRKSSCCGLESDSLNEHSPARPNIRRKRKLKRMCVDEIPVLPSGKRKRPQRIESSITTDMARVKIKPLNQSVVDKIEKICHENTDDAFMDVNECDAASESSLSWSGGEGHEGDDELTDWGPPPEPIPSTSELLGLDGSDAREIRAGCRRVRDERPGFSITTVANEKVARFLQDANRMELLLVEGERSALERLADLYSLEMWFADSTVILKKTDRTPCMQPTQRHHSGFAMGHKRIRIHEARQT